MEEYPLHLAVASGNYNDVVSLIETGLNINEEDMDGFSPLDVAVKLGYINIVRFLLEHGAAVDHNSNEYWEEYPIHLAAKYGHLEILKLLMDHDIENYSAKSDYSLIHLAAEEGHINLINYFLDIGMDVDITSSISSTPLSRAASCGRREAVNLLFSKGASINHKDINGNTPLHCASENGHIKVVKFLIEKDELLSAENDGEKTINQTNYFKHTPLHCASLHGHIEVVKYLIEKGALFNERDQRGRTCLHIAVERGHKNIVELLVMSGASYTLIDGTESVNLLRVAAEFGETDILKYFIERGGTIDFKNLCDKTILHTASLGGHRKLIEFLVNKGADVNAKSISQGNTPLHYSAQCCFPEITELLIQKGSDIEARNNMGFTPLDVVFKLPSYHMWCDNKRDVVKIIVKYMLLKNKDVEPDFFDDYIPNQFNHVRELNDFYCACAREVERMETMYLNNTDLSLDILFEALFDETKFTNYLCNENIKNDLKHVQNYCRNFSIYANLSGMVTDRIEKAVRRQQLLEQASLAIDIFTPKLPLESKWKIFSYLSSRDLNNFVKSIKNI